MTGEVRVTPDRIPRDARSFAGLRRMVGADGFATLLLSNVVVAVTLGSSLLWAVARVYRVARDTPAAAEGCEFAVVLGFRLRHGRVTAEYARRLLRARALLDSGVVQTILILGGRTGGAAVSEAEQGRRFLAAEGLSEASVLVEEHSAHTLENLCNARAAHRELALVPFVLVTSRYHLARSDVMARGLRLQPRLCAAEDRLRHDAGTLLRIVREGWFLHWYVIGRAWSRWTGNRRSLARIS